MWFFWKKSSPYTLHDAVFSSSAQTKHLAVTLYDGVRNSDHCEFSIFEFKSDASAISEALIQNSVKAWKTIRHPSIPTFIEDYEYENNHYVVVERIKPLDEKSMSLEEVKLAAYTLVEFLEFLKDANCVHGALNRDAMFMTEGNELKVGGLSWMTISGSGPIKNWNNEWKQCVEVNCDEESADLVMTGELLSSWTKKLPRRAMKYVEGWKGGSVDRADIKKFLDLNDWKNDDFIHNIIFLRDLAMKNSIERDEFFKKMKSCIRNYSPNMQEFKILPELLSSLAFAKESSIIPLIFAIEDNVNKDAFSKKVMPVILPLFDSKDRNIRVNLLSQIDKIIPSIPDKVINDSIFPNVIIGFNDSVVTLRAATIVSMVHFAPHLNQNNSRKLIRELKALTSDPEPSIRCNSIVCIAKIAEYIEEEYRNETLINCFSKAARDQFPQTRKASISAWKTCSNYFDKTIIAVNIIPSISFLCIDQCEDIKIHALRTMKQYVDILSEGINLEKEDKKPIENHQDDKIETNKDINIDEDNDDCYDGWEIDEDLSGSFSSSLQNEVTKTEKPINIKQKQNEVTKTEKPINIEQKQNEPKITKVENKQIIRDETIKPQIRNKQKIIQTKNRKERKVRIEKVSDWDDVDWDE